MHHRMYEDDEGNTVEEFDAEAIAYFIQGLETLRDLAPGEEISSSSIREGSDHVPEFVGEFILRRAVDHE